MAKKIKNWNDIYGHQNLLQFITKHIEKDNVPDVVMFHGNSGIGKSSIAKLLAIDVVTRYDSTNRNLYIQKVIDENKSTDTIKLFNMSEIQEKEEEIQKVKAEFNLAFAPGGRKVLILDEAHNMSKKAQDSVLTELEHLPKGIYVFICTTEVGALRDALKSRCKAEFALNGLTDVEAKKFTRACIQDMNLSFDVNLDMIVSTICIWANNQPRKIANLLENFNAGEVVAVRDLEVFINVSTASSIIELLKYIYGSMPLGIDYLNTLKYDDSFVYTLLEVTKVALGYKSASISNKDTMYIREFMHDKDESRLIKFTAEVAGLPELRRRRIISAFMKANIHYKSDFVPISAASTKASDFATLIENVENIDNLGGSNSTNMELMAPSLEELFSRSDTVE
jgi:DNA polymerase III delta prime subunit